METKMQEQGNNGGQTINIDISNADQAGDKPKSMNIDVTSSQCRAGLSKEELMKYANQPFWVRLRNILFATFWIVWVTILVVAIGYVVNSPKCFVSAQNVTETILAANSSSPTTAPASSG